MKEACIVFLQILDLWIDAGDTETFSSWFIVQKSIGAQTKDKLNIP